MSRPDVIDRTPVVISDGGSTLSTTPTTSVVPAQALERPEDVALRVLRLSEPMASATPDTAGSMMALVASPSAREALVEKARVDAKDTIDRYGPAGVNLRVVPLSFRRADRPVGLVDVAVWFVGVLRFEGGQAGATWRTSTFTLARDPGNGSWGLVSVSTRPGPTPPGLDQATVGSAAQLDAELVGFTPLSTGK